MFTRARTWQVVPACFSLLTAIVLGLAAASCHHRGGGAGVTLQSLAITPPAPSFALGFSRALVATGTFSDHTTRDLTASVTWTTSDAAVATVGNASGSKGVVASLATGSVQITATDTASGKNAATAVTITAAVLVQLDVTPAIPSVAAGFTRQFTATGVFSDHTTLDLTTAVNWNTSNAAAVTISNTVGSQGLATGVGVGSSTISATHLGSGIQGTTAMTVTPAVLVSIDVEPASPSIALGFAQQFTATGTFSDSTTQDLTATVTWSSSATTVATIDNAGGSPGRATSFDVGTTTITATDTATSISGQTSLTVTPAVLVSLAVTPAATSLALGYSQQFTATGTFSDSSTQDLTTAVTWSSSDTAVATISNADGSRGLATSAGTGVTTITAMDPATGLEGTASLEVTSAVLVSIDVTPSNPSLALGYSQQFTATGTFSDHTTLDLTAAATWNSSAPAVATISNAAGSQGLATSAGTGATTISATDPATSISGQTSFTVTSAVLVSIDVTPANASVALGYGQQFTATGIFSDNTTQDLTAAVTWSSSAPAVAMVGNAVGSQGFAWSCAVGSTTIAATDAGGIIAGSANLVVTAAVLVSIDVTPASPSVALGYGQQFTATGTFSDNTTQDLTGAATWSSSTTATATISNVSGAKGFATSAAVGSTTISATDPGGGIAGSTTLTVTPAVLVSIAVTPPTPSLPLGYSQQFAASGTFSDNTTQDITTAVTWSSSTTATATISNANGSRGLASTSAVGSTTITATDSATGTSAQTTLTVTAAVLVSIAVTPAALSIPHGYGQQFTATGTFSDASTRDITTRVTWSSSVSACATISNAAGSEGRAASSAPGSTTIVAIDSATGVSGSATLTVTPAVLVSIAVTPANPSVALGVPRQFTATGTFSDSSTRNLTATVTWISSSSAVATISNASGSKGLASTAATGSTTIGATDPGTGIAGSTTLTVTAAVLVSLAISPLVPTVALGSGQQFTATGTYSDNSTQNLTAAVVWNSSNTAAATISNAGFATSVAQGSTTIGATHTASGLTASTTLAVGDPIVFRRASRATSPGALTLSIATPTGTAANEVMLAAIAVRPSSATITAPSGWTLLRRSNNLPPNPASLLIYRRVATATEPATHKWTFSNSQGSAGCIVAFQGVDTANVVDVHNGQATTSSLTHATPSVTTTAANDMLVTFHMITSSVTWTPPAGMTEVVDTASETPPSNGGVTLLACWQFQAVAGSTGARTATASNNPGTGNAVIVALRD